MATKKSQRIGIWVIAIAMLLGTVGSFVAMILSTKNTADDQAKLQEQIKEYQKQYEQEQAAAKKLSDKYYTTFKAYKTIPSPFDASSVGNDVVKTDLKTGEGDTVTESTTYKAYYMGWNPEGKVFDSSFNGEALKTPIDTSQASLISGWNEGVLGMKAGGVRQITIPADKAYGEKGSGDTIPPNTPIRFIIMVIEVTNK